MFLGANLRLLLSVASIICPRCVPRSISSSCIFEYKGQHLRSPLFSPLRRRVMSQIVISCNVTIWAAGWEGALEIKSPAENHQHCFSVEAPCKTNYQCVRVVLFLSSNFRNSSHEFKNIKLQRSVVCSCASHQNYNRDRLLAAKQQKTTLCLCDTPWTPPTVAWTPLNTRVSLNLKFVSSRPGHLTPTVSI